MSENIIQRDNKSVENNLNSNPNSNNQNSNTNSNQNQNRNETKNTEKFGKKRKMTTNATPTNVNNNDNNEGARGERGQQRGHDGAARFNQSGSASWTRLTGAPAWDLPPNDNHNNQTFTGRCRLFVANLPQNVTEDSLRELFGEFGKISDIYIGKGNQFAFIKMDTRSNAEMAKQQLDGRPLEGRTLRVRLAAHASAIRVTQLPNTCTNELLHLAFSSFGQIERAIVCADDRGRSLNEGIVEFARKSSSQAAIKKCQNECLLLTSTPIPVVVQPLESRDEEEGVLEKSVIHSSEYRSEREMGPRFAEQHSMEWEMARKWKQLSQIESQRREQLEQEFKDLREGLKQQMEVLRLEETTKQLREQLRQMESESQKLYKEREQRLECERRREEQRRERELLLRQQEEQLLRRRGDVGGGLGGGGGGAGQQEFDQDLGQLRRQESELRQQANALQQLLDRQEQALRQMSSQDGGQGVASLHGVGIGGGAGGLSGLPLQPQMDPQLNALFPGNSSSLSGGLPHPQLNPQSLNPQIQQANPIQNQFLIQNAINQGMRAHSGPPPHGGHGGGGGPPQGGQHGGHYLSGGGGGGRAGGVGGHGGQGGYKRNRRF